MNFSKNKSRICLTVIHLEDSIRGAESSSTRHYSGLLDSMQQLPTNIEAVVEMHKMYETDLEKTFTD